MRARYAPLLLLAAFAASCSSNEQDTLFGRLPSVISRSVTEGGPNPADIVLTITNNGSCQLLWSRTIYTVDGKTWLDTPSTSGGMLNPAQSTNLTIRLNVLTGPGLGLAPGTYTGTVTLTGTCTATGQPAVGSPVAISVNLTVTPNAATISLDDDDVGQDVVTLDDAWEPISLAGPSARHFHSALWTGKGMLVWGGVNATVTTSSNNGYLYEPLNDEWTLINSTGAPTARWLHSAVWTGSQMLVWGGVSEVGPTALPSGGVWTASTDAWTPITNAGPPAGRFDHRAVYAGGGTPMMIVWGGQNLTQPLNTGGRYVISTNTWLTGGTSLVGAPSARAAFTMIWTGDRQFGGGTGGRALVWGGTTSDFAGVVGDGAAYDPIADTWTPIPTGGAPSPRSWHSAVWTGKYMIIWGGMSLAGNDGGLYDPARERWLPMSTVNAPSPRFNHVAVWTGAEMIVWGGKIGGTTLHDGARYDPETDTWTPLTDVGAPGGRNFTQAVWTGDSMLVWGGQLDDDTDQPDGGRYH